MAKKRRKNHSRRRTPTKKRRHDQSASCTSTSDDTEMALVCSCCFDTFEDVDRMVSCRSQGHLFCLSCFQNQVNHLVFGQENLGTDPWTKELCIYIHCFSYIDSLHGIPCISDFLPEMLDKALPPETRVKYEQVSLYVNALLAGVVLATCPKCGYSTERDDDKRTLRCAFSECRYSSCLDCGEASHGSYRCYEVETSSMTQGRVAVEEAMAAAKVRKCPTCEKPFVKQDGCNKVTCGCGTKVCYVCQVKVEDYDHFCDSRSCAHDKCQKCPLYTNGEDDDLRAVREAGNAAAAKVEQESMETKNADGETTSIIRIDVEHILNAK